MPFDADLSGSMLDQYEALINQYAADNLLDPYLVAAVIMVESGGNPNAINEKSGATGLGQIMPQEAGPMFVDRPTQAELEDPETNIYWLTKILARQFNQLHDYQAALYHYSGGKYWPNFEAYRVTYWTKIERYYRSFVSEKEGVAWA